MAKLWQKVDPRRWVALSSPVTLGFALAALIALILQGLTGGASTRLLFSVYRAPAGDVLSYPRLFLHVLGHADFAHYAGNMGLFLVLGPLVEARYGSKRFLLMLLITALVTGLAHLLLSPGSAALGASGLVFMLIMLSAIGAGQGKKVPLTLILVALIYLGGELFGGIFQRDSISQLGHIMGGVCGIVMGLLWKPKGTA